MIDGSVMENLRTILFSLLLTQDDLFIEERKAITSMWHSHDLDVQEQS